MPDELRVNDELTIALAEIEWRFGPSGGPGGQHANRANTRAEARLDLDASPSLTDEQRHRLVEKLGPIVRVTVDEGRSQSRNRELAVERLRDRLASAWHRPARRRATKPSKGAKKRRLESKRQRSQTKAARRRPRIGDD